MEDLPTMSLYDFAEVDKNPTVDIGDSSYNFAALPGTVSDLGDLDSCVEELSVDLQNLIDQSAREDTTHNLFPDLIHTTSDGVTCEKGDFIEAALEVSPSNLEESTSPAPVVGNEVVPSLPLVMPISLDENYVIIEKSALSGITLQLPTSISDNDGGPIVVQPDSVKSDADSAESEEVIQASFEDPIPSTSFKSPASLKGKSRRKPYEKGSQEYIEKRERNNVAVRKSRDKAKQRQAEINGKVKDLSEENQRLQKKVDLLTKELSVIKGLFANVGVSFPAQFQNLFE